MSPLEDLQRMKRLLEDAAGSLTHKTLECGPGVSEALAEEVPEREPQPVTDFYSAGVIGDLFAIPIIDVPDMTPGQWRIIRHDRCQVIGKDVSHMNCTVLSEGVLTKIDP